jgi:hypothetical protein
MAFERFFIAANIILDLETGGKKDVLMLVNSEGDASYFRKEEVESIFQFVKVRLTDITWKISPTNQRTNRFIIEGMQHHQDA